MRSMLGLAFIGWAVWLRRVNVTSTPMAFMGFRYTRILLTVLALGELIGDKLPSVPSRKTPVPFFGRIICGGIVGATIGAPLHSLPIFALIGATGAIAGTLGGASLRSKLAALFGKDLPAALAEDLLALAIGAFCFWNLS
jgi:uncharacterized membrane protein